MNSNHALQKRPPLVDEIESHVCGARLQPVAHGCIRGELNRGAGHGFLSDPGLPGKVLYAATIAVARDEIESAAGMFYVRGGVVPALSFAEAAKAALVDTGTLTVKGSFTCPPEAQGGKHRGGAVGSTMGFSYAAQVVEVTVDEDTALVTVDRVWAALDCGYAINPLAVVGQVEGSVWMGMGQALSEETHYLNGLPAHGSFLEYRVPTISESPPIDVQIVESHDPLGPFGAKEASEGALAGFSPALVAAVANAIGVDLDELPVTPDRVMEALVARRRRARLKSAQGVAP